MQRALFLDRDGVINVDHGYIGRPGDFELIGSVVHLLRTAQDHGYLLVVVTNQSGIARGYFGADDYAAVEAHMRRVLAAEGIRLTAVYHCPHHPHGAIPELTRDCECRKPAPGMILQAAREHDIDLGRSILVGDKPSDIVAAKAAGVGRAILVDSTDASPFGSVLPALSGR